MDRVPLANFEGKQLLDAATATNGVPTLVTDGIPASGRRSGGTMTLEDIFIGIYLAATGGTPTATLVLWGYGNMDGSGTKRWYHVASLNANREFSAANNPREFVDSTHMHTVEKIVASGVAERYYLQIVAIAGTNTAITAGLGEGVN